MRLSRLNYTTSQPVKHFRRHVLGCEMDRPEETQSTKQFERLYTTVLLSLVAVLLLISILYTTQLWWVKAVIAVVLTGISAFLSRRYLQER